MASLLVASIILVEFSFPLSSAVTIGLDEVRRVMTNETVGKVPLCAEVMDGGSSQYAVNISIAYQDRSAYANMDYEDTPYHFLFTPSSPRHCFNVTIINDDRYEVREEAYVNLTTTDSTVMLSPNYLVLVVDDDDGVAIGWEQSSYTVGEGDGQFPVCVTLTGYIEAVLQQSTIRAVEGTAKRDKDFRFPDNSILLFPQGSNSSSKLCFTVTLIKDIEYEEVKNFAIYIVTNGVQRLTRDPQTTTIVITDYNEITRQKPNSTCDGINHLISGSSIPNICSSEGCEVLTCAMSDWSLSLSIDGCRREVTLNVTDYDQEEFSETFSSQEHAQELNHTYNNETGSISLTTRVVPNEQKLFYLLAIESVLFNLTLPTTAIPVECSEGMDSSTSVTTSNSLGSSVLIIIISSVVGGVSFAILLAVTISLAIVCGIVLSRKRKKETITKKSYW